MIQTVLLFDGDTATAELGPQSALQGGGGSGGILVSPAKEETGVSRKVASRRIGSNLFIGISSKLTE